MKKIFFAIAIVLLCSNTILAQQFIDKAVIEYEVKTNIKKTMSNDRWGEMLKENLPEFKTAYYDFTFADNKSIYKFSHWDPTAKMPEWMKSGEEDNIWYFDFSTAQYNKQKSIAGSKFIITDSIPRIKWRITNENREIAGFNCRKAVGKIFDSVYVFAFYTDEITIPGGPCSISGLPGMILGITIPRMYSSYIATKVMVNGVNVGEIKPVTVKKPYTTASFKTYIEDKSKDWYRWGDDEAENNRLKNLSLWGFYL